MCHDVGAPFWLSAFDAMGTAKATATVMADAPIIATLRRRAADNVRLPLIAA
jgi:hypothetical protein